MTRPQLFLIRMVVFLIAVLGFVGFLHEPLAEAFMANPAINGLIMGILLLGILYNFRQVLRLYPEVEWIDRFRQNRAPDGNPPKLLAPMATMIGGSGDRLKLSATSMRTVLDGIASRLDESRDISRYTIGLLVFLGLLGTFWGLLDTVSSVGDVIASLSVSGGDFSQAFSSLKQGLEQPLDGMGTAFSSSLFGLSGSLVLGFLDLQAGQSQNRFFNELEDWLSSVTRLSSGALGGEGDQAVPAYVQALLEQTAESLENLQRTLMKGEESRIATNNSLRQMSEQMSTLTDHMRTEQMLMKAMASNQGELHGYLKKLAEDSGSTGSLDEQSRAHLRNLDHQMGRLVDELASGRVETLEGVRSEIRLLARTIAALAEGEPTP